MQRKGIYDFRWTEAETYPGGDECTYTTDPKKIQIRFQDFPTRVQFRSNLVIKNL